MVTFYPGAKAEDFHTAITPAPITATEYGFWSMDRVGDECELVRLYPEAGGIYALFLRYPREAGEGFSVQMATIANTFEATP